MVDRHELKIEYLHPSDVLPHPTNAKLHPPEQVAQIAASIREYGFNDPIAIDENSMIIEGHGRWKAVLEHLADDFPAIPVIRLGHLSDAERRAYRLAHNKTTMNTGFDLECLHHEMIKLKELNALDLEMGFSDEEILGLLNEDFGEMDPEEEWIGMPEYKNEDQRPYRTLLVHFTCQEDVDNFAALVKQKLTDKTKFIWYPEAEIGHYADKEYASNT